MRKLEDKISLQTHIFFRFANQVRIETECLNEEASSVDKDTPWNVRTDLKANEDDTVRLRIYFAERASWIFLSEVSFLSLPVVDTPRSVLNLTESDRPNQKAAKSGTVVIGLAIALALVSIIAMFYMGRDHCRKTKREPQTDPNGKQKEIKESDLSPIRYVRDPLLGTPQISPRTPSPRPSAAGRSRPLPDLPGNRTPEAQQQQQSPSTSKPTSSPSLYYPADRGLILLFGQSKESKKPNNNSDRLTYTANKINWENLFGKELKVFQDQTMDSILDTIKREAKKLEKDYDYLFVIVDAHGGNDGFEFFYDSNWNKVPISNITDLLEDYKECMKGCEGKPKVGLKSYSTSTHSNAYSSFKLFKRSFLWRFVVEAKVDVLAETIRVQLTTTMS